MKYIFLYFLWPFLANTQSIDPSLADLFFKGKKVSWQKNYSGLWDDAIPVKMELLSDGLTCKGYLYFGDSKNKYIISGFLKDNDLTLEEQDLLAVTTARLFLKMEGATLKGTWFTSNNHYNASISLKEGTAAPVTSYWVKAFTNKADPGESQLTIQKEFNDQLNIRFYYKKLNKSFFGTSEIKEEEYAQEAYMEDYLHNRAGKLQAWKINDKRYDILYKLGNIEYSQSLELQEQVYFAQETYADHSIAVDILYPRIDKPIIAEWTRQLVDSFVLHIQNKKRAAPLDDMDKQESRIMYRMSIWPQVDFLSSQLMSGMLQVKNSWEDQTISIPYIFDLKKGILLTHQDLVTDATTYENTRQSWIKKELDKLKSSSGLAYHMLDVSDFNTMTIKKEGLAFSAPFDVQYGQRQIIIPYAEIRPTLSSKYFPL